MQHATMESLIGANIESGAIHATMTTFNGAPALRVEKTQWAHGAKDFHLAREHFLEGMTTNPDLFLITDQNFLRSLCKELKQICMSIPGLSEAVNPPFNPLQAPVPTGPITVENREEVLAAAALRGASRTQQDNASGLSRF